MDGEQELATHQGHPLRVLNVSKVQMNPYVLLLQEALAALGVQCSTSAGLSPRLARSWRGSVDLLHIHWLELLYEAPRLRQTLRRWLAVFLGLGRARADGCRVVYTVHNLSPHEPAYPTIHRLGDAIIFRWADAVHVHDEEARRRLAAMHGRLRGVHVIPHGSYVGAYPNTCSREDARQRLGLGQDHFVFLFLGQIRPYKGVEDLITAFGQMADASSELVIAGHVHDPVYASELSVQTRGNHSIHTWFEYVQDREVQYFMQACDVCVLPYRQVTTSGAGVLAFSFGKPIVAPALGGFVELCADGRGFAYDAADSDGLRHALQQARQAEIAEAGHKALAWAEAHRWSSLAPRVVAMYREALGTPG